MLHCDICPVTVPCLSFVILPCFLGYVAKITKNKSMVSINEYESIYLLLIYIYIKKGTEYIGGW